MARPLILAAALPGRAVVDSGVDDGHPIPARRTRPLGARFRRAPIGAGALVLLVLVVSAVWGWIAPPYAPQHQDFSLRLSGPSAQHWLGVDHLGRDVLSRLLVGARVTLLVATLSMGGAMVLGFSLGAAAAASSRLGTVVARGLDAVQAFPFLILALVLVVVLGASFRAVVLALAIGYAPYIARVLEGRLRAESAREYALAARAIGASPARITLRHVVPNTLPLMLVQASEVFAAAILDEAALSFVGLGPAVSSPTWGRTLFDARPYMEQAPHTALAPAVAISLVVLGANLFGNGLRDALDPIVAGRSGTARRGP